MPSANNVEILFSSRSEIIVNEALALYLEPDIGGDFVDYENSEAGSKLDTTKPTSLGLYLTPEKALDDLYDSLAHFHFQENSRHSDFNRYVSSEIDRIISELELAGKDWDKLTYSAIAMDDESSWLLSRQPQFVLGTLVNLGSVSWSVLNADITPSTGAGFLTGSLLSYQAFNGTSESIDKILTFRDHIDDQKEVWMEAKKIHEERGFTNNNGSREEIHEETNHPLGSCHYIAYKKSQEGDDVVKRYPELENSDGPWYTLGLAESFPELLDKRDPKQVVKLLENIDREIPQRYLKKGANKAFDKFKSSFI